MSYSRPIILGVGILFWGALSTSPAQAGGGNRRERNNTAPAPTASAGSGYESHNSFSGYSGGGSGFNNGGSRNPTSCVAVSEDSSRRAQVMCAALQGVGGAYDVKFRVPSSNSLEREIEQLQSQAQEAHSENRNAQYISNLQRAVDLASGAAESAKGFIAQANQAYSTDTGGCRGACRDMCDEIRDTLVSAFTRCENGQRALLSELQTELAAARGDSGTITTTDTSKSLITDTGAATPSFFDIPTPQAKASGIASGGLSSQSSAQPLVANEEPSAGSSLTPASANGTTVMAPTRALAAPAARSGVDFSSLATKFNSSDETDSISKNSGSGSGRAPLSASAADKKSESSGVTYDFSQASTATGTAAAGKRDNDPPGKPSHSNFVKSKRKATKAERALMEASDIRDLEEAKAKTASSAKPK